MAEIFNPESNNDLDTRMAQAEGSQALGHIAVGVSGLVVAALTTGEAIVASSSSETFTILFTALASGGYVAGIINTAIGLRQLIQKNK